MSVTVPYQPDSDAMRADPAAALARLREESPIQWVDAHNFWVVARYDDCRELARDPRLSFQNQGGGFGATELGEGEMAALAAHDPQDLMKAAEVLGSCFNFMDPPDHTRIRSLVSKAFAARATEARRPDVEKIAGELLDQLDPSKPVDLVDEYANPLPIIVICHILGIPTDDRPAFRAWFDSLERMMAPTRSTEEFAVGLDSLARLLAYTDELVEQRREQPRDDLISAIIQAEEEGDRLSSTEVIGTIVTIFGAASTTTQRLIANGLVALLRNPDQLQRLRQDPSLWSSAIEELLRLHVPDFITGTPRIALEDIEIRGHRIKQGQSVRLLFGAANRDPERFDDPDRLDVGRADNKHLMFGRGEHFCLGAGLARLEGEVALRSLVDRFAKIELLDDEIADSSALYNAGFATVPIRLTPA